MRKIIAIVGRPNVGKSTLFNRLTGRSKAIIHDLPGVTRDRNYGEAQWDGLIFTLIDTGGFEPGAEADLSRSVQDQARVAMEEADAILFLADGREGPTPTDGEIVHLLRTISKPVFYCINKMDGPRQDENLVEFYRLGIDVWYPIAAKHNRGLGDLMDEVAKLLPESEPAVESEVAVRIAVLGRPNVGKSSLVNRILGYERVIVNDSPGTTRDPIDTMFQYQGQKFTIIDTAGIRKKSRISLQLEKYCVIEALRTIERCDVGLILIDALEGVTEQDVKIAGLLYERGRGCILVVNKWDLIRKDNATVGKYVNDIKDKLKFLDFAPIVFVSALSGQRVMKVLELAQQCNVSLRRRIETNDLNRFLTDTVQAFPPPRYQGRRTKIFYGSQVDTRPPTFVFFVNFPQAIHFSYQRYLANRLRENYGFEGTPLWLKFRPRSQKPAEERPRGKRKPLR